MDERRVTQNIKIEGAKLIFKNFAGKETTYNGRIMNKEGDRNFGVILDEDAALALAADGWNIKRLRPKEDDPEQYQQPWLKVRVKYGDFPPIANLITSKGKIRLDEDTIDQLDWSNIEKVDLVIRPYNYPASPTIPAGVSAYLKSIYVTVREDDLEAKYADLPYLNGEDIY